MDVLYVRNPNFQRTVTSIQICVVSVLVHLKKMKELVENGYSVFVHDGSTKIEVLQMYGWISGGSRGVHRVLKNPPSRQN